MSTWEAELGKSLKHGSWPNPFRNSMKRLDVLACEDTWQAEVEMWTLAASNWFWSSFIPSPVEITRKTFTGSYKCGFYGGTKWRSPLDIIWKDGRTSRMLLEVTRPVTTGLFYIWAGETLWDALNTWHTLQLKMEMCDADQNEVMLRDGSAPMQTNPSLGAPAFSEIIYDPKDRSIPNDTIIGVGVPCQGEARAYGYIESTSGHYTNVRVGIRVNGEVESWDEVGEVMPFEVKAWSCAAQGGGGFLDFQPYFEANLEGGTVLKGRFVCTRFTANIREGAPPLPPPAPVRAFPKRQLFCEAFEPRYMQVQP